MGERATDHVVPVLGSPAILEEGYRLPALHYDRHVLSIDVASVPEFENDDDEFPARNAVQQPVPADPNSKDIVVPRKLPRSPWERILGQRQDRLDDSLPVFPG